MYEEFLRFPRLKNFHTSRRRAKPQFYWLDYLLWWCRQEDSLDSGVSTDNSASHRPPLPWSGNPADRSKINHIRRPDQQFQAPGSIPPTSTICHHGHISDSETEFIPNEGQKFGWTCQRQCVQQIPKCLSSERRIQEWTERTLASSYPGPVDYYTLGARRHRQVYNGAVPASNPGVIIADNPIMAKANRYVTC